MLEASRQLHKYFHDCKDVLGRILEKQNSMPDEVGRDTGSVSALQRKHTNFIQDLQGLQQQVQAIQEQSATLQVSLKKKIIKTKRSVSLLRKRWNVKIL